MKAEEGPLVAALRRWAHHHMAMGCSALESVDKVPTHAKVAIVADNWALYTTIGAVYVTYLGGLAYLARPMCNLN